MELRTVDLGEVTLSVLEAGVGGSPLLLVHGFTGCKEDFADEVDRLAALGHHVVAPDLRGHGDSSQPADEAAYSLSIFEDDLARLIDALGWDRFDVLGHSMGGMVVQLLAVDRPEWIDRLILMDTHHGTVPGLDAEILALGAEVARTEGLAPVQALMKMGADPLDNPAFVRVLAERPGYQEFCDAKFLRCSPAMFASMVVSFNVAPSRLDRLAGLTCPTLVIVGELDLPFLEAAQDLVDTIPGAVLAVMPDGGHSPQFESTAAWRVAVDGFLGEARRRVA